MLTAPLYTGNLDNLIDLRNNSIYLSKVKIPKVSKFNIQAIWNSHISKKVL